MIKLFFINFSISLLGASLFLLFRAALNAKSLFSLLKFIRENYLRWGIICLILIVTHLLLLIEGEAILEVLTKFGLIMPVVSNGVLGFSACWLTCKFVKKKTL